MSITERKYNSTPFLFFLSAIAVGIVMHSCRQPVEKNASHRNVPDEQILKGKQLAVKYCQSCHLLPDPSELDARTWEVSVLPAMGPRLGIFSYGFQRYPSYKSDKDLPAGFYPDKPVLSDNEWQQIIDYYTSVSPDSMPRQQRSEPIRKDLDLFAVNTPAAGGAPAGICLTKLDTSSPERSLFMFDLVAQKMFRYGSSLQLLDTFRSDATITDIDFRGGDMLACNVNIINPNNGRFGKGQLIRRDTGGKLSLDKTPLFDSLARPVQMVSCDLNNDGRTDYLVCEFGHLTGALAWMENKGDGRFEHHILRAQPGVLKTYVEDVNNDGLQDVWALFAQGDEGIYLFMNKGNGKFEEQAVLRFPALYGSTYFEFADINNDGKKDIIYTCGDNADYSLVLKPYHGVYIYLNQGDNRFKQSYFFPVNGCYKAVARDYDGDGDLDIATIAFFADYAGDPDEGFVYLRNEGNLRFTAHTLPETRQGRWLTMDAGDIDGDGKPDIMLGNFSVRPSSVKPVVDWTKGPSLMLLKNIHK